MLLRNKMDEKRAKADAKSLAIVLVERKSDKVKKNSLKQDIWEASVLLKSSLQQKKSAQLLFAVSWASRRGGAIDCGLGINWAVRRGRCGATRQSPLTTTCPRRV